MKKLLIAVLLLLSAPLAISQGVRYDIPPILSPRGIPIPNPSISLCPATAVISGSTCGTTAQAFTDQSLGTACTSGLPVTPPNLAAPQGVGVCSATGDSLGNAGFWLAPGSYIYCVNAPNVTGKCTNLTVPVGSTAGGTPTAVGLVPTTRGDRQIQLCNPDFEGNTAIPPPCWTPQFSGTTISYETASPAPNKLQSIKLTTTIQGAGITQTALFSGFVADTYSFTSMAKSDGTGVAQIAIAALDKNGAFLSSFAVTTTTSTSWTQLTASGSVPASAVALRITLQNSAATQPSSVWFDQIEVRQTNFPTGVANVGLHQQNFTSSGTFTIPLGITQVKVTVVGGGGGGAGAAGGNTGAGGGSGGAAFKWLTGLTPGNTLTVTVGTGGSGGASGANNGTTGNNSSVASGTQTISTITANGGNGASTGFLSAGPSGGTASGGDLNLTGNAGGSTVSSSAGGAGVGAASIFGGGAVVSIAATATAGGAPGAGGAGATNNASAGAGGNGANGIVIFEWVN